MMAWSYPSLPALTDQQFISWQQLVEERTGIDLSQHRPILQSGLTRRLRELDCDDYDAYFRRVRRWPESLAEWQTLIDRITVKETSFFRQPAAYALVRSYLDKRVKSTETLDLWSVGCATGEEPYGLAICASEVIARSGRRAFFGVLANDISAEALQQARRGQFSARRLDAIPEALRQRYFAAAKPGYYEVVAGLRERVCYAQANLLDVDRLPHLAMDVIFCQNVLVYFRRWRTKRVLDALVERLKPGGMMVLGPGEAAQWQHPSVVRLTPQGVSAYLRRIES